MLTKSQLLHFLQTDIKKKKKKNAKQADVNISQATNHLCGATEFAKHI